MPQLTLSNGTQVDPSTLDSSPPDAGAYKLSQVIKKLEGGDYNNRSGDSGSSAGAYQWNNDNQPLKPGQLPSHWKNAAAQYLKDPNAPMTPENQNYVAYQQVKAYKDAGRSPEEIDALWNGAHKDTSTGTFVHNSDTRAQQFRSSIIGNSQPQGNGYVTPPPPIQPSTNLDTTSPPPAPPENLWQKAGDVAKGVGNFLFPVVGDISSALQGKGNGKTGLQVAGDVGSSLLSAATLIPGLGEGALAAKVGIGGAEALGEGANVASKVAPTLMGAIGKNAALGAGFGVSGALGAGETDPTKIAESTAIAAGTGGILGGAGKLASDKLSSMAGATAESRLAGQTSRLKTLSKSFTDNSRPATATSGATNPITTLEQNGLTKGLTVAGGKVNAEALTNINGTGTIDNLLEEHSSQASKLVKSLQGGVTIDKYQQDVLKAIASNPAIRDVGGVSKATTEANRIFADFKNSFGDELPYEVVDNIRAGMNRVYDPVERDVARTIGDTARSYLYNGDASNVALRSAMQNESELIRAKNFVEKLNGTTVPGGQLGKYFADLIGAGAGASLGNAVGGPLGGSIGTVAGGALTHKIGGMIQGNYFNPMFGKSTGLLQKTLKSRAGQVIKGTAKAGLLRGASGL